MTEAEGERHWRCKGCGEWFDFELTSHAVHAPGCDGSCYRCPMECGPIVLYGDEAEDQPAALREVDGDPWWRQYRAVSSDVQMAKRCEACRRELSGGELARLPEILELGAGHETSLATKLVRAAAAEIRGLRAALDASERADGAA